MSIQTGNQEVTFTAVTTTELFSTTKAYLIDMFGSLSSISISRIRESSGGAFYITVLDKNAPRESSATNIWFSKGLSQKLNLRAGDVASFLGDTRVCRVGNYDKICAIGTNDNYSSADDLF